MKETLNFQAETQQLLHLMIHSLYSNKEIFLRELISNAADAADKLRFEALSNNALMEDDQELKIEIDYDKEARTLTIRDNGIGMSKEEVVSNIGTIAKSGTKAFLQSLSTDQIKDANFIGQFGVGFYSSFIVADKVEILTRRAGVARDQGVHWISDGADSYTIEEADRAARGTQIILHLRSEEDEFLDEWRIKSIITRYADHITLPIQMRLMDHEKNEKSAEFTTVNHASTFWRRAKNTIEDKEYQEFYKQISYDYQEPLSWLHFHVEGKQDYIALLYIPAHAPFDLWQTDQDRQHGIKLYVQRVFIMEDNKLMPRYLRFVRGLVDSNDLPLNVSRELLQNNRIIDSIRNGAVKRILDSLKKLADEDKEKYLSFWGEFGQVIKEGLIEDANNKDLIADILRFTSTKSEGEAASISLDEYIARMQEGQDKIYYLTAENYASAMHSPLLEVFRKKDIEVLLLSERVDEWIFHQLSELKGKTMQSIAKGDLDLDSIQDQNKAESTEEKSEDKEISEDVINHIKDILKDKVSDVKVSKRLVDSPACIVLDQNEVALHLQPLLKMSGQKHMNLSKPILEINPEHGRIAKLKTIQDEHLFHDWVLVTYGEAVIAAGGYLENSTEFVLALHGVIDK